MRLRQMKSLIAVTIVSLFPFVAQAQDSNAKREEAFKTGCVKTWMERADKSSDKVSFKNIGEKFCDCAANKPTETEAEVNKAVQVCLSQVILHDTMDNVESEHGLTNLTDTNLTSSCANTWNVIYPDMDTNDKKEIDAYCACATPKLMDVNKKRDELTDKDWYAKINEVAADCSGTVAPDKGTVEKEKSWR